MKGIIGIQMHLHPEFHKQFKELKNERVKKGKEKNGELSDKRFSLTLAKLFKENVNGIKDIIINANINLKEE